MKLDLYQEINLDTAEVRKAEKQTHYTVTEIGGTEAHAEWLNQQKILEEAYQVRMAASRAEHTLAAVSMVASGAGDTSSRKLTAEERAEVMYTVKRNIADQRQEHRRFVTEAQNEAERLKGLSQVFVPEPIPPKSIGDRITYWLADFISKAFEK
jgi:superfamily I DNA and RNA helicase